MFSLRIVIKEVPVIKGNIPDNAESVCNHPEFIGITEMAVDVHLLNGRIGGSVGRHGGFVFINPLADGFGQVNKTVEHGL